MAAFLVSDSELEALNFRLDDLEVEGTSRFEADDFSTIDETPSFVSTCGLLFSKLKLLDHSLGDMPSSSTASFISSICDALKTRHPSFSLTDSSVKFDLLNFLCAHLQAERLMRYARTGATRREAAAKRGQLLFQLDKICRDLQIVPDSPTEAAIISATCDKVQELVASVGAEVIKSPPVILAGVQPSITPERSVLIESIGAHMASDFALRRRMLMLRLDVTIQSFLWGEKAQGKEGEIVAAMKAHRDNLTETTTTYTVADAVTAPSTLIHELSKRVTDSAGVKSFVKTVIIGAVPDRGGRAGEMRAKDFKSWGGGGRGGGGGGGRGGRGGGGRGGGGGGGGGGRGKGGGGGDKNKNKGDKKN